MRTTMSFPSGARTLRGALPQPRLHNRRRQQTITQTKLHFCSNVHPVIADDLRIVLELSRTGRLSSVARRLQVDETTVSRKLARLEADLGTRLVDRDRRGWRLTDAGTRLIPHAELIETARNAAVDELTSPGQPLSGTVRVLAPDGFGAFVLIPGLANLRERHPDLVLEILTSTTQAAATARDFDIAVALEPAGGQTSTCVPIGDYHLRLYAAPEYLEQQGRPASLEDVIARHPLVWYIDSMLDVQPLRLLESLLPGARAMLQCNNITGQLMAARHGLGIAPLPTFLGDREPGLICLFPEEFSVRRTYWAIVPDASMPLRRVTTVLAAIREAVQLNPYVLPPAP